MAMLSMHEYLEMVWSVYFILYVTMAANYPSVLRFMCVDLVQVNVGCQTHQTTDLQ